MASTPQHYHHGRSPAAWTGTVIAAIGFIVLAAAAVMGPNWALAITGAAVVLVAGIATMVMKAMGLGQP